MQASKITLPSLLPGTHGWMALLQTHGFNSTSSLTLFFIHLFCTSVTVHMCMVKTFLNKNITFRQGDVMDFHSACIPSSWHVALIALFWSHCQPSSPSRLGSNVSLMASGSSTISTAHLTSGKRDHVWFSLADTLPRSNHSLRFP